MRLVLFRLQLHRGIRYTVYCNGIWYKRISVTETIVVKGALTSRYTGCCVRYTHIHGNVLVHFLV